MTDAKYSQCRIVPARFLKPETAERLLNGIVRVEGVRRIVVNGPRLPATVPYGPARGKPNPHTDRKVIHVGDQDVELQVQAGMIILEIMDDSCIPELRKVCDEVFTDLSYVLEEGRFMKASPSLTDYAKYGPDADMEIVGLVDPRRNDRPVIIQGLK